MFLELFGFYWLKFTAISDSFNKTIALWEIVEFFLHFNKSIYYKEMEFVIRIFIFIWIFLQLFPL